MEQYKRLDRRYYNRSKSPRPTLPFTGELPNWLAVAHRLSLDSTHPEQKMASVLVRGGRVLSLAVNSPAWGRHAESRTLAKISDTIGSTIYVMRSNRRISKPCHMCEELLRLRGVKKAIYINALGQVDQTIYG